MENRDFVEIDIFELIYVLKRKWYIILVCVIVSMTLAYTTTKYYIQPVYSAEATLFLGKEKDKIGSLSLTDLQASNQLIIDYREIIKSKLVTKAVMEQLELKMDYNQFISNTEVTTIKDSRIFKIKFESEDPEFATRVVNELAQIIVKMAADIVEVKNVKIIDLAEKPKAPVSPNLNTNVGIAGILGLMVSVFGIFLIEYLNSTFKKPTDIERNLGLNVLGSIPNFWTKRKKNSKLDKLKDSLITIVNPGSPSSEAFRELRTNIQYKEVDNNIKTILITSGNKSDGKSTTAVNLAVVMAQSGKNVLILDCDLRKPTVNDYFGMQNAKGVTNLLLGDESVEILKVEEIDNLSVLPSGPIPPNAADLIGSNKMKNLMEILKDRFDLIIVDSPPVGLVTDAAILAKLTDSVIFTLLHDETSVEIAKKGVKALKNVNANVIGAVMGKIDVKMGYSAYYGYK